MIPPQPLHLFAPQYADPIDPSSQVDRLPGTDAPCECEARGWPDGWAPACTWPFCPWKPSEPESE